MLRATFFVASLWCLVPCVANAQDDQVTQVFQAIDVVGNARFSDQNILATAGLAPGQPLTRVDVEMAVDALDFTGEFEEIAISPSGDTLVISVTETPAYSGDLTFGLGYDSDSGVIGVVGLSLTDIFMTGVDFNAEATVSGQSQTAGLELTSDTLIGDAGIAGVRLTYESYDYDNELFGYERLALGPFVRLALNDTSEVELRYTYVRDDLRDVTAGASGILQGEAGERDGSSIGATFRTAGQPEGTNLRWSAEISQDFIDIGGDNTFNRTEGDLNASVPIAQTGFKIRTSLQFGMIRGGDDSGGARATDRFTLGGSAMRGFERGGISVRDVAADTATSLGGERYAVVRTDLVLPVLQDREGLDTFIFADVGNVWGLNDTSAADGIANTDGKWRSSAGFGFSLSTDMGRFEAHFAIETDDQAPDLTQEFGLAFRIGY